ncbi:hypothetical protein [Burkholderia sp. WAC0059]|nr:hypothetical protein [Burkholderia sp. WAC0059]
MKRLARALIAGMFLAATLGGCIVVPAPGYYHDGGHYRHWHDYH